MIVIINNSRPVNWLNNWLTRSLLLLFLITSCNQNDSGKTTADTTATKKDTLTAAQPSNINAAPQKDSSITIDTLSISVLKALKAKAYKQLALFIHPQKGLRFSPYGRIDTLHGQQLSAKGLLQLAQTGKKTKWGIADGTGDPINLSLNAYFGRFVYDVDFLKADKKSINKIADSTNTANNIKSVYPASYFIEYYFSGFKPELDGMDWRALRLVFEYYNNKPYLVAIIHDQWTI